MDKQPHTVQVRHLIEVIDDSGYPTTVVARTELAEGVVLSAGEPEFDPVLSLIEAMSRETATKATAQVVAFEHLKKANADAVPKDETALPSL